MWISKEVYQDQRDKAVRTEAIVSSLQQHNIALQTTMDWMRVRLSQLEIERAQLIHNYTGVKISVPQIEDAAPTPSSVDVFNQMPSFDSLSPEEAARQGLDWDDNGRATLNGRLIQ